MSIIAVIFDYDDTIVPDSTTELLEKFNVDVVKFWQEDFKALIQKGIEFIELLNAESKIMLKRQQVY